MHFSFSSRNRGIACRAALLLSFGALATVPVVLSGCGSSARERVTAPIAIGSREVTVGDQLQLTADVSGTTSQDLVWTVVRGEGSFSDTVPGLFTAPTSAGTVEVRAALRSDSSRSNTAFITVRPKLTVTPAVAGTFPGLTVNLAGVLTGVSETISWSVEGGESNGRLTNVTANSAQYVAPSTPGVYTVRVATADGGVVRSIPIVVQERTSVPVVISPASADTQVGQIVQLTAQVPGATDQSVTWTTTGGLVTPSGQFSSDVPGTFTVTATSTQNPGLSSTATVRVTAAVVPTAPLTVSPNPAGPVTVGQGIALSASRPVTWSVTGGGTISASGFYTAPAAVPTGPVTVTATPTEAGLSPVNVTVTVVPAGTTPDPPAPAELAVAPNPAGDVQAGGTLAFSATRAVTWSVTGGGSITPSGFFTAPATVPAPDTVTVTATPADGSGVAPVSVTVRIIPMPVPPPGAFAVAPNPVTEKTVGETIQFSASRPVTWTIEETGTGATITPDGLFTAPATVPGTPNNEVTVKATATDLNFTPVLVKVKIVPRGTGGGTIGIN